MDKAVAAHPSRHDREIAAIRKIIVTRMKMLVQQQKAGRETDRRIDRLVGSGEVMRAELRQVAAEGRETRRDLQRLIRSLERGGNGHGPTSH